MTEVFVPTPIYLTERAVSKAKELISGEGNPDLHLRVFVTGGGCSGFQYKWEMLDEPTDGELVDEILVVDRIAEMFVIGCTVDYVTEFGGSYLKVINPNATASCGCGESFAV